MYWMYKIYYVILFAFHRKMGALISIEILIILCLHETVIGYLELSYVFKKVT